MNPQNDDDLLEGVIGFDALYKSMYRCQAGVSWKDSVAHFCLNGVEECLRLEQQLKDGTYAPRPQRTVQITHPKPREAVSVAFRDRVYQRSLNDNAIYPAMTKGFIRDNAACQKGKGTDFARDTLDRFLREFYHKYGLDGWVLQCDIKGYYPNMPHAEAERCFARYLPSPIYQRAEAVLRGQYGGDTGYNPGSQMVQIAGISVLSRLDHFIKEQLGIKWYLRYMDDFPLIHHSRDRLEHCKAEIGGYLEGMGFRLHLGKTRIYPVSEGITILGFAHKLTGSGKVLRLINSENVRAERRKLARLVALAKQDKLTKHKVDQCYQSWRAHAEKGDTANLLKRMDKYYKSLWEGDNYEHRKNNAGEHPRAPAARGQRS